VLRRRSIRLRIIVLVLVPVIGLIGLYAEVLNLTLGKVLTLRQEASIRDLVALPVANVQRQLANERGLALQYLARPGHDDLKVLLKQKTRTDAAIRRFGVAVERALDSGPVAKERRAFLSWQASLKKVRSLRSSVVSLSLTKIQAAGGYSSILEGGDNVLNQAIIPVLNGPLGIQAADLLSMTKASQALGEESDLVRSDLLARSFPPDDLMLINQLAVLHQEQVAQTLPDLDPALRTLFTTGIPQSAVSRVSAMESAISAGPARANQITLPAWTSAETQYRRGFRSALLKATKALADQAASQAQHLVINLLIAAGIGLIAIIAATVVGIILGRGLIRQLNDLKESAVKLSTDQLPGAIRRLRAGEEVSVGAEVPQLEPGSDEIGQVREAFNAAARTAIGAAVDEVKIRQGVNDVFRSLARRNQSLLTRQLQLLDSMERRVHDPEELADLFRVDHMTTRMRRHAEGLLIVAGGSSGRTWREPVPIVDVMRAAAAEVEDYTRVRATSRTSAALAGHAVADVIHLLAELLENAATFSPANTPVRMDGERVGRGVIVEIEDRGLGMSEDQLAAINKTLLDPPLFDLSGSDQLGLFIAGQLGKRHEVRVTLRASAYGGVTAVVLIPTELVIDIEPDETRAIAGVPELGGRAVPELSRGTVEPAMSLAAVAPLASGPATVHDLDARAVPSEAATAIDMPHTAGSPADQATTDIPSWITEPGSEHSAWPGAVPLVSGPLPARSTTKGPAADAPGTAGQAPPGSDSAAPAAFVAGPPGADFTTVRGAPDGPPQSDLPTRRPGKTGLTWGENGLPGSRWAGFPLTGPSTGAPAADAGSPAQPRTDAWAPATPPPASKPAPAEAEEEEEEGPAPGGTTKAEQVDQAAAAPAELEGLPVRVRQANLAPQLLKATSPEESAADEPAAPSPESARSTMAAIQLGWQRGRRSATEQDGADELSGGPAEVTATGRDSSPDDSSAGDTAMASADDIEPASDGETAGETETTSGEFRTTPSPKQARRRGRRRS
jgi:signal transduction histidine kinase